MADDDEAKAARAAEETERKAREDAAHTARLAEIEAKFAKERAEIRAELQELGAADGKEKAELRQQVEELQEWRKQAIKAEEEREKVKDSETTLVVPPSELPSANHPSGSEVAPVHTDDNRELVGAGRKRGWRRFY